MSFWRHIFHRVHSNLESLGCLFYFVACRCIYWLKFLGQNFRHATRRGVANFTLWTALSEATLPGLWFVGIRKGVGRTHKDPPLMFRVLYLARPRTGTRSFMVDAGEMKSHRPRIWCLLARFSRLFPPALSGSGVRLKDREGRGESLFFLEFFKISRA